MERLRKLQYKAVRKVTGAYHGARQETLENIAKIEPASVKVWDMQVRAAARILEIGTQDDLITRTAETREAEGGRDWGDHSAAWVTIKKPHYNTCLEEILASTGKNREREIVWDFHRGKKQIQNLQRRDPELGTRDTPRITWETRIRDLEEEEGWKVAFTDGSGLDNKAAGVFCSNPTRTDKERNPQDLSNSSYLGTRATHIDGELEGIALALEAHNETGMLAILSDCRPAIRTVEKLDSGMTGPRSHIEARIQSALETRESEKLETHISWVKGHKDIKGNELADKLSKHSSILGHESEGTVTPAGLKAWARRVRAEARGGGNNNGPLGWCRKALSAYTWCRTNKGPQNEWLFKIKKTDTESCKCGAKMTGTRGRRVSGTR